MAHHQHTKSELNATPYTHQSTPSRSDARTELSQSGTAVSGSDASVGTAPVAAAGAGTGAGAGGAVSSASSTPGKAPRHRGPVLEQRLKSSVPLTPAALRKKIRLENQRTEKWRQMLTNWDVYTKRKQSILKRRIRKGIPDVFRGAVWVRLVGADARRRANPDLYAKLLRTPFPAGSEMPEIIERDINRTFPRHAMFADEGGIGQSSLCRVLRAYAIYDEKVGYCQGMGFIAAMFLSYMPEEDAFFLLLSLLQFEPHKLAGLYAPGMPMVGLLHFQFHELVKKKLPKLSKHLEKHGLHPTIFASQWFITVFTYSFRFDFSTRVWDCFLFEGWKIAFRVGLGLLKVYQRELLAKEFEGIMTFLARMPKEVDVEHILTVAFKLPLKRKEIDVFGDMYKRTQMSTIELAHKTAV